MLFRTELACANEKTPLKVSSRVGGGLFGGAPHFLGPGNHNNFLGLFFFFFKKTPDVFLVWGGGGGKLSFFFQKPGLGGGFDKPLAEGKVNKNPG